MLSSHGLIPHTESKGVQKNDLFRTRRERDSANACNKRPLSIHHPRVSYFHAALHRLCLREKTVLVMIPGHYWTNEKSREQSAIFGKAPCQSRFPKYPHECRIPRVLFPRIGA